MSTTLEQKLNALQEFSACDISDALLKLQKLPKGTTPHAGFLSDITPFAPFIGRREDQPKVIAPASTFKFINKNDSAPDIQPVEKHGFPPGKHWVDWAQPGTIAVLEQPAGQTCAVLGGIMASRMKYLGVKGVVVSGRVRDLSELKASGLSVFARATSTVGTGAAAKAGAREVPVTIGEVTVHPGDIIFCDPLEGIVAIPRDLLDDVLALIPKLVEQDEKVKEDVVNGSVVADAFKKHRSNL